MRILKPVWVDLTRIFDEVRSLSEGLGDVAELTRVRARLRSDDEDRIALFCEDFHGFLAIRRRVADISCLWEDDMWKFFLDFCYQSSRIIDREGCLGQECEFRIFYYQFSIFNYQFFHIFHFLYECEVSLSLIDDSYCFLVSLLPDIEDVVSLRDVVSCFTMDLLDERASRIDPADTPCSECREVCGTRSMSRDDYE